MTSFIDESKFVKFGPYLIPSFFSSKFSGLVRWTVGYQTVGYQSINVKIQLELMVSKNHEFSSFTYLKTQIFTFLHSLIILLKKLTENL